MRIDLPVDAHLPPDYIGSDRLRLEGYRRLAAAPDDARIAAVVEELVDRYGALPEPAQRLVAVARLRLLCREYGVTEVTAASEATLRLSPLTLPDSQQLRLKRHVSGRHLPRDDVDRAGADPAAGGGVGAPRIRDSNWCGWWQVCSLALDGKPQTDVDITKSHRGSRDERSREGQRDLMNERRQGR